MLTFNSKHARLPVFNLDATATMQQAFKNALRKLGNAISSKKLVIFISLSHIALLVARLFISRMNRSVTIRSAILTIYLLLTKVNAYGRICFIDQNAYHTIFCTQINLPEG